MSKPPKTRSGVFCDAPPYATVQRADEVLAAWASASAAWALLSNTFKEELLVVASDQLDTLQFIFPKCSDTQRRALPVLCNDVAMGLAEAELACVLQAVHLVIHADELADDELPGTGQTTETVCFEESGECILYALGALLLLESYIDLSGQQQ